MSAAGTGEEVWSVGRLLDWTQNFFGRCKLESPRLDAELLLAHVLGCARIQLYTTYEEAVASGDRSRFKELVRRRSTFEPVAYLVGEREFYGLPFAVGKEVLIPRPETEHLVDAAVAFLKGREAPTYADVGTGSGCIAVAIASELETANGVGLDCCSMALATASANADRNGVSNRVSFAESDLLCHVDGRSFDLIVSNPPYVAEHEWDSLPADVKDWEPRLALVAGNDGLEIYRKLIPQAAERLKPSGRLMLEIGHRQEAEVIAIVAQTTSLKPVATIKDYGSVPRVVVAERLE